MAHVNEILSIFLHVEASKSSQNLMMLVALMKSLQSEFYHLRHCCHCQLFICSYGLLVHHI
jgi:hypothetical protein